MLNPREKTAFHKNTTQEGKTLDAKGRETYLQRFLPESPNPNTLQAPRPAAKVPRKASAAKAPKKKPIRSAIKTEVYFVVYTLIQTFFGLYIRLRTASQAIVDRIFALLYYHHRTPELIQKDVKNLSKLPEHLSVVLTLQGNTGRSSGLEKLLNDVGEIAAWCASAGIPAVSIYERTGVLKHYVPQTHHVVTGTLQAYFGKSPDSQSPSVSIRVPNQPSFSPPYTPPTPTDEGSASDRPHLTILLISEDDGRNTMVDLTKTLTEMAQKQKITADDVTYELIDAEISESVMGEPDLLLLFGPQVILEGYPPWQVRLTEIFHVRDNTEGVGYQVFLRALHKFAKAQMRFGR